MSSKAILFTALVVFSTTSLLAAAPRPRSTRVNPTAVRALTTTTLAVDRTFGRYGEPIEVTITVTPSGGGQATGIVWLHKAGEVAQLLLDGGKTIIKISGPVGVSSIHAEYLGDANFEPSVSNAISITVVKAPTRVEAQIKGPYYIGGSSPLSVSAKSQVDGYSPQGGDLILSEGGVSLIERSPGTRTFYLDKLSGGEHTLVLSYTGSANYEPSSTSLKVTILLPAFAVSGSQITEGNGGETTVIIPVTLSVPVAVPTRVSFATVAGSATEGVDYRPASGVLEFGPRDQVRFVEVKIIGDALAENDESFSIVLSNPENGAIDTSSAMVVIGNDDAASGRRRSARH